MNRETYLKKVKRIIIKVGTSNITTDSGRLDTVQLKNLVGQIGELKNRRYEVLLVSSGAIAAGVEGLGLKKRPDTIPELQAAASVGQGLLLQEYINLFKEVNLKVGQVLVTQFDTTHRQQYLNARNTLEKLLQLGTIPIINENDTTAVDEIKFGDNDTLAAMVTTLIKGDLLVMLTVTEGLLTHDPSSGDRDKLLSQVEEITPELEALAGGVGTKFGQGGMVTKLQAAKIVTFGQAAAIIANGFEPRVLLDIVEGKPVGTFFVPRKKSVSSRKLWIAFGRITSGTIFVDKGAKEALVSKGKSLLPAGITRCRGKFEPGDAVDIADTKGDTFAKGLANFSSEEINKIKGLKSADVSSILSEDADEEVIHRDCLLILK